MTAERLFKLLEGISIVILIAGAIALGIPKYGDLQRRKAAERVLADVELVREAVYRFYSDSASFPAEAPAGEIPESLSYYLPATFGRVRPYGTIEYRNWPLRPPAEEAPEPTASNVIAVSVIPRDPRIAATASQIAYAVPQFTIGPKFFFVLFGS